MVLVGRRLIGYCQCIYPAKVGQRVNPVCLSEIGWMSLGACREERGRRGGDAAAEVCLPPRIHALVCSGDSGIGGGLENEEERQAELTTINHTCMFYINVLHVCSRIVFFFITTLGHAHLHIQLISSAMSQGAPGAWCIRHLFSSLVRTCPNE